MASRCSCKLESPKPSFSHKTAAIHSLLLIKNWFSASQLCCTPSSSVVCLFLWYSAKSYYFSFQYALFCFVLLGCVPFFWSVCVCVSCDANAINWLPLLFCSSYIRTEYTLTFTHVRTHTETTHWFVLFDGGLRIWFCLPSVFVDCLSFLLLFFLLLFYPIFSFSFVFLVYLFPISQSLSFLLFFVRVSCICLLGSAVYDFECIKSQVQLFQYNLSNNLVWRIWGRHEFHTIRHATPFELYCVVAMCCNNHWIVHNDDIMVNKYFSSIFVRLSFWRERATTAWCVRVCLCRSFIECINAVWTRAKVNGFATLDMRAPNLITLAVLRMSYY